MPVFKNYLRLRLVYGKISEHFQVLKNLVKFTFKCDLLLLCSY